jgi:hypothetical protein
MEFFTNSQEGINMMATAISGLSAEVDVFKGGLMDMIKLIIEHHQPTEESAKLQTTLGEATAKFFNIILGGLPHFLLHNKAMESLRDRMGEAKTAAEGYTTATQATALAEIGLIVPRSEANKLLVEAREKYAEGTGTIQYRIDLLQNAVNKENEVAKDEIDNAKEELKNLKLYNQNRLDTNQILELSNDDKKKEAELTAQINDLETESNRRQIRDQKELNALLKEQNNMLGNLQDMAEVNSKYFAPSTKQDMTRDLGDMGIDTKAKEPSLLPKDDTTSQSYLMPDAIKKQHDLFFTPLKADMKDGTKLTEGLTNAFDTLFSASDKGFKGMAQAFEQMLKQMVEQLLAKAAVFGILTLISGGTGALAKVATAGLKNFSWFASGGVSSGGLAMVGENGPELVNLSGGSRVFSNSETNSMLGGGQVTFRIDGTQLVGVLSNQSRRTNSFR